MINEVGCYYLVLDESARENGCTEILKYEIPGRKFKSLQEFKDDDDSLRLCGVTLFDIDFFLFDETMEWEAFVSCAQEICIFGCSNAVKDRLEAVFCPFAKMTFEQKILEFAHGFRSDEDKRRYLSILFTSYPNLVKG